MTTVDPTPLSSILKCGIDATDGGGLSKGYSDENNIFWVQYQAESVGTHYQERSLRVGFQLDVYPALEGVYTIHVHYEAIFDVKMGGPILKLDEEIQYHYINKPNTPSRPSGPVWTSPNKYYNYSTVTTDPNGDMLRYQFDWDDGTTTLTDWVQPGVVVVASHSWSARTYLVRVRAQDCTGAWSEWSEPLLVIDP